MYLISIYNWFESTHAVCLAKPQRRKENSLHLIAVHKNEVKSDFQHMQQLPLANDHKIRQRSVRKQRTRTWLYITW